MAEWRKPQIEPRPYSLEEVRRGRLGIAEMAARYHPDNMRTDERTVDSLCRLPADTHILAKRICAAKGIPLLTYVASAMTERVNADAAALGID